MRLNALPALAVATLLGAGLGIHLGRAAIGAVDPFYFTEPVGTPSYAELVPAASLSRPWSTGLESSGVDYGWPASCVGCGSGRTLEPAPYDGFQNAWTPPAEASPQYAVSELEPDSEPMIEAAAAGIEEELQRVERYAYYPVTAEAARAHGAALSAVIEEEQRVVSPMEPRKPLEALLPSGPIEISRY